MDGEKTWANAQQRVDGELKRLDQEIREVRKRMTEIGKEVHERINVLNNSVGEMNTQVAASQVELRNVSAGVNSNSKKLWILIGTLIAGLFGIITTILNS